MKKLLKLLLALIIILCTIAVIKDFKAKSDKTFDDSYYQLSDKEQIAYTVNTLEESYNTAKLSKVIDCFSEGARLELEGYLGLFSNLSSHFTKSIVDLSVVKWFWARGTKMSPLVIKIESISVQSNNKAKAKVKMGYGQFSKENAQLERCTIELEKEDEVWLISDMLL